MVCDECDLARNLRYFLLANMIAMRTKVNPNESPIPSCQLQFVPMAHPVGCVGCIVGLGSAVIDVIVVDVGVVVSVTNDVLTDGGGGDDDGSLGEADEDGRSVDDFAGSLEDRGVSVDCSEAEVTDTEILLLDCFADFVEVAFESEEDFVSFAASELLEVGAFVLEEIDVGLESVNDVLVGVTVLSEEVEARCSADDDF